MSVPLVGISYKGYNYSFCGKNTLSKKKNGEGDAIVEFDALELEGEGDDPKPSKMEIMLTTLKEKLEPADYAELMTKLGIEEDISNAELLEKLTELLGELKGAKKEEGEEEKPEGEEEEKDMAEDRKAFIKKCMEEGKDLATCSAEFKEKYPDPGKKDEGADELGKSDEESELAKKFKELEAKFAALEKKDELAGVTATVENLVKDKHLAPVQKELAIKLMAEVSPETQGDIEKFFRTTQKFSTHQDAGLLESGPPGSGSAVLTPERKRELIELHGISGLIADKADKSKKLSWEKNN